MSRRDARPASTSPATKGLQSTGPQEMVERALAAARSGDCIVIADESSTANLRWAGVAAAHWCTILMSGPLP